VALAMFSNTYCWAQVTNGAGSGDVCMNRGKQLSQPLFRFVIWVRSESRKLA